MCHCTSRILQNTFTEIFTTILCFYMKEITFFNYYSVLLVIQSQLIPMVRGLLYYKLGLNTFSKILLFHNKLKLKFYLQLKNSCDKYLRIKKTPILANLQLNRIFFIWVFSFHMDPEVALLPSTVVADWTLE